MALYKFRIIIIIIKCKGNEFRIGHAYIDNAYMLLPLVYPEGGVLEFNPH